MTASPEWRLRDARRAISRYGTFLSFSRWPELREAPLLRECRQQLLPNLDREIRRLGADAPLFPRAQGAQGSAAKDDGHEPAAPAETQGARPDDEPGEDTPSSRRPESEGRKPTDAVRTSGRADRPAREAGSEHPLDDADERAHVGATGSGIFEVCEPKNMRSRTNARCRARLHRAASSQKKRTPRFPQAEMDEVSRDLRGTSSPTAKIREVRPADRRDFSRVMAALRRWCILCDADVDADELSPRVDGRRLVRELVSRRVKLAAARRREFVLGQFVAVVDVSGSCAVACRPSLAAAQALCAEMPERVGLIVHSNGELIETHGRAKSWGLPDARVLDGLETWASTMAKQSKISGVLWLGDFHGFRVLEALAAVAPTLVVDDHACTQRGPHHANSRLFDEVFGDFPRRPVAWLRGVRGAVSLSEALTGGVR